MRFKHQKRALAVCMAAAMVMCSFPAQALAEGQQTVTGDEAQAAGGGNTFSRYGRQL